MEYLVTFPSFDGYRCAKYDNRYNAIQRYFREVADLLGYKNRNAESGDFVALELQIPEQGIRLTLEATSVEQMRKRRYAILEHVETLQHTPTIELIRLSDKENKPLVLDDGDE